MSDPDRGPATGRAAPASVTAIVLAGGASSRFGGDKLAADLDGAPVLHHALLAVAAVADGLVLVVGPTAPAPGVPAELTGRIAIARDARPLGGPLAGLAAGLDLVDDNASAIALVVGGDMPWLVTGVLRLLVDRIRSRPEVVAMTLSASGSPGTSSGPPLPMALRPAPARTAIAACLSGGRRSLRSLQEAVPSAILPAAEWHALDPVAATLRDIDTRDDLRDRSIGP